MTSLVHSYAYASGLRSRWYMDHAEAAQQLKAIPRQHRGVHTIDEPLQTSPGIWRVDDTDAVRKEAAQ